MQDAFYEGVLDDSDDANNYSEWYDTRSDVYENWYDTRSDVYGFYYDMRGELWSDDIEKVEKTLADSREDRNKKTSGRELSLLP